MSIITRRAVLAGGVTAGLASLVTRPSFAQEYPTKDVTFICGYAAGGGGDLTVRFLADAFSHKVGRSVIVENKTGASGNIATEYAARSEPDGYTVYITSGSVIASNWHLFPESDGGKKLDIVATVYRAPTMVTVPASSPYTTIAELVAAMKEKGDKANYAVAGSNAMVVGALFRKLAGLDAIEVPYTAAPAFLNDLYGGHVDFAMTANAVAIAQQRSGEMRILAVSSPERLDFAPEFPTLKESGYDIDITSWFSVYVPKGTPEPVEVYLNEVFSEIVGSQAAADYFTAEAAEPYVTTLQEARDLLSSEVEAWGGYIALAGLKA
jgi:tripartite-type tricarboxylate transporter receptor subunit TctC